MLLNRIRFAVVGHPNKGKSSIVATLAENNDIEIAPYSGTTKHNQSYVVETSNAAFEIIDTPGFQRPAQVLRWLKQRAATAAERKQAVSDLVTDSECHQRFPDESQLLKPLIGGAAVFYVVDGSRPYGAEYEAEMEILRWSGAPSIGLINPIGEEDHIEEWQSALEQYFKVVRVFNPMQAAQQKKREIFEALTILKPEWRASVSHLIADFEARSRQRNSQAAQILAELLVDCCQFQVTRKTLSKEQAKVLKPLVQKEYQAALGKAEKNAHQRLKSLYGHSAIELGGQQLQLPPDLFDTEQWFVWGLNKQQLLSASAVAGAATGALIDVSLAGHSLLLGAVGGGLLGAGGALLGADKLVKQRIAKLPMGGYSAVYGPVRSLNFPYVVISRFIHLNQQLMARTHAVRSEKMELAETTASSWLSGLDKEASKKLEKYLGLLVRQKDVEGLVEALHPLFISKQ